MSGVSNGGDVPSTPSVPEVGGFYAGGGMTCRVLEVLEDEDVRVEVVLRGGKLLKRRPTGVIPLRSWDRMARTVDPARFRA